VTEFWRRRRQSAAGAAQVRADSEFARWQAGTARVVDTLLSSNRLTMAGVNFVRRMSETASSWKSEPVSARARGIARHESEGHLARWELRHGPVPRSV
jgi:hypothetical protein